MRVVPSGHLWQGLEHQGEDGGVSVLFVRRGLHSHPLSLRPERQKIISRGTLRSLKLCEGSLQQYLQTTHLPTASTALASAAPISRIFSPSALALSTVFVLNTEVSFTSGSCFLTRKPGQCRGLKCVEIQFPSLKTSPLKKYREIM